LLRGQSAILTRTQLDRHGPRGVHSARPAHRDGIPYSSSVHRTRGLYAEYPLHRTVYSCSDTHDQNDQESHRAAGRRRVKLQLLSILLDYRRVTDRRYCDTCFFLVLALTSIYPTEWTLLVVSLDARRLRSALQPARDQIYDIQNRNESRTC
jgi:hypothetical protein